VRVSQRLDYAMRALVALAQERDGHAVVVGDLAARLRLPKRFLEQQITTLAKRGLVACRRGAAGGCTLARPAELISVGDVVRAVQGEVLDVPRIAGSAVAEMWAQAAAGLAEALDSVTLRQLADRQAEMDAGPAAMYYI
jgi:Rrf2 family protein